MSEIDQATLAAARSGDVAAFERLLSALERPVFNYIYRLVGQRQDAEDLTQECFLKVYRHLGRLDPGRAYKSWIFRIATNTVYDFFRKKGRAPLITFVGEDENLLETFGGTTTYDSIEGPVDAAALGRALQQQKPVHKAVLVMFYQEELTYSEIADALGIPMNTVKTHLRRAKIALRNELIKDGHHDQR